MIERNKPVRDCEKCIHSKVLEITNFGTKYSCEAWTCDFEPRKRELLPFEPEEEDDED